MLAFDLDGPTSSAVAEADMYRDVKRFLEGAYGPHVALPRLLQLLAQYGLPATFFIPSWVVEQWPATCQSIVDAGHEVAGHGHVHESFFHLDVEDQRRVLARSQAIFERVLGSPARGFRAPSGDWTADTPQLLVDHGYEYSSSFRDDDRPYVRRDTTRPLVEIPARVDMDDYAYFAYTEQPAFPRGQDRIASYRATIRNWYREFRGHHAVGGCLSTIWHPKVTGTPGRTLALAELLDEMTAQDDVWFARGSEICDHVGAHGAVL